MIEKNDFYVIYDEVGDKPFDPAVYEKILDRIKLIPGSIKMTLLSDCKNIFSEGDSPDD